MNDAALTIVAVDDPVVARVDTVGATFRYSALPSWVTPSHGMPLSGGASLRRVEFHEDLCKIQFSAPRQDETHNLWGVRPERLVAQLEGLLDEAGRRGLRHNLESAGMAKVTRIDLCRDFEGVHDAPVLLAALAGVHVLGDPDRETWLGDDGRPESLHIGNGSHTSKLYRKDLEHPQATSGHLRFEGQLNNDGISTDQFHGQARSLFLAQVTDAVVEAWAHDLFEQAGFATRLRTLASMEAALAASNEPSGARARILAAAVATGEQTSLAWTGYGDTTAKALGKKVREYGVVVPGLARDRQLDWQKGQAISPEVLAGTFPTKNLTTHGTVSGAAVIQACTAPRERGLVVSDRASRPRSRSVRAA